STVMWPPGRKFVHVHSQLPPAGLMRMQEPWSRPITLALVALKSLLWNVSRSPVVSPAAPVFTTVSVTGCSTTCSVVGWVICGADDDPDATATAAIARAATATVARMYVTLFSIVPPCLWVLYWRENGSTVVNQVISSLGLRVCTITSPGPVKSNTNPSPLFSEVRLPDAARRR